MNNLDIRKRFLKTQEAKGFANLVSSDDFKSVLTTVLAQMQQDQVAQNSEQAMICQWKMQGAKQFVSTLLSITQADEPVSEPVTKSLNYDLDKPKQNLNTKK
jgi:hypothetical protein